MGTLGFVNPLTSRGACIQALCHSLPTCCLHSTGDGGWEASQLVPASAPSVSPSPFPRPQGCCGGSRSRVASLSDAGVVSFCTSCWLLCARVGICSLPLVFPIWRASPCWLEGFALRSVSKLDLPHQEAATAWGCYVQVSSVLQMGPHQLAQGAKKFQSTRWKIV